MDNVRHLVMKTLSWSVHVNTVFCMLQMYSTC